MKSRHRLPASGHRSPWFAAWMLYFAFLLSCAPARRAPEPAPPPMPAPVVPAPSPSPAPVTIPPAPDNRTVAFTPSFRGPLNDAARNWIERTLASLSLRQRVAQMVTVWVLGDYTSTTDPAYAEARDWIVTDEVGGVLMSLGSPIEVAAKVNDFQRLAKIPLLVSSDLEPGLGRLEGGSFAPSLYTGGSATILPSNMAIGATGNPKNAYVAGLITGNEAKAIGINLVFAPVVDVNDNPANPVINTRSFGEDAVTVGKFAAEFVAGLQHEGVASTAKHFPGHGNTSEDSHLTLPVVTSSRARLDSVELVPFRAVVAGDIAGIMTAHIALPAIGHDGVPATLEPSIMTGLLRDTLHFQGVTITDALSMEGIGKGYTVERSAVLAVQAGADMLLKPTNVGKAIDAVVAAVEAGTISRERIDASVRRLLELKLRCGAIQHPIVALDSLRVAVGSAPHRAAALGLAQRAITLLRDRDSLVPYSQNGRTLIVVYTSEQDIDAGRIFSATLHESLRQSRVVRVTPRWSRAELDSLVRADDRVIVSTYVRTIEGAERFAVAEQVARWIDDLSRKHSLVVVANGNPYVIRDFPHVGTYLATYGRGPAIEEAAAKALGPRGFISGRSPISLPGFFARGDGLDRRAAFPDFVERGVPVVVGLPTHLDSLRNILFDAVWGILHRAVADSAFPGASLIVGNRSRTILQLDAGNLDWAPSPRADRHTLWDLASLTKVVATEPALMQLVEQGKVDINAPVQRYLPQWTGKNKDKVLIRHLMTHSSGMPAWRPLYKEADSPDSAMQLVYATQLDTLPGVRYVYSDLNAVLLGEVVRAVTGRRIDAYAAEHVFGPLKMEETMFLPPASLRPRIAPTEVDPWRQRHLVGEVHDENAAALGGVAGHAGLFSTVDDLGRYARMYLNGGVLDGARIAKPETIRRFTTVYDSAFSNRALLWETPNGTNSAGHLMKRPAFGHTGFTGGDIWIDPAHDIFFVLLTNRVNPTRANTKISAVRQSVADAVMRYAAGSPK